MSGLYDAVRERLARSGLPLTEHEAEGWLELPGFGTSGSWRLVADVHQDRGAVILYSIAPDAVPEERREAAALLVNRINYGLLVGSFELNLDTGDLRLRTYLVVGHDGLDTAQLDDLVGFNLMTMDRYLPLVAAVSQGEHPATVWAGADEADPPPDT